MQTIAQDKIEILRQREWRGEPLAESEVEELAAFYRQLEQAEETYLAASRATQQAHLAERTETLTQLQDLLAEKQSRLARIRSLIREMQELEATESRLLAANIR